MAIKKSTITSDKLPLITSDSKYYVRYRITSPDNSLKSQWSSFYEMSGNTIQDFTNLEIAAETLSGQVSADERYILLQWDTLGSSTLQSATFDIFAQWSTASIPTWATANYEYVATVSSNNFSIPIPTDSTYGKFAVQIATHQKTIDDATIFALGLGQIELDTIYDAPNIDGGVV